jgi:uncharacterized protein
MKILRGIALLLVLIGAINWGLWGFFQFDLVAWLCGGNTSWLSRLVYAIVGLAGVWNLRLLGKCKMICGCSHEHESSGSKSSGGGCCKM